MTGSIFSLQFPQHLADYDEYAAAQRAVDHLSDRGFPVEHLLIVGTDLKQVERVTGRLNTPKVAGAGALSGLWLGLFVGLLLGMFADPDTWWVTVLTAALIGAGFGAVWALLGYAATRGQRDFSSVRTVIATRYEVLVEHKHRENATTLLAEIDKPNPFA